MSGHFGVDSTFLAIAINFSVQDLQHRACGHMNVIMIIWELREEVNNYNEEIPYPTPVVSESLAAVRLHGRHIHDTRSRLDRSVELPVNVFW